MDRHRETEIRDGWVWPIEDKRCWRATMRHIQMPQDIMQHVENRRVAVQAGGNCGVYAKQYADQFETLFMMPNESFSYLSSKIIKEIAYLGGTVSQFVPSFVEEKLKEALLK